MNRNSNTISVKRSRTSKEKCNLGYKNLLDILKRKGCQRIETSLQDMIPFTQYITKMGMKDKIYISSKGGMAIFSTNPINVPISKKSETEYQNIIHK